MSDLYYMKLDSALSNICNTTQLNTTKCHYAFKNFRGEPCNPYYHGRQFNMHFLRIIPLFRLGIFVLCQSSHSRALAPACCALVF